MASVTSDLLSPRKSKPSLAPTPTAASAASNPMSVPASISPSSAASFSTSSSSCALSSTTVAPASAAPVLTGAAASAEEEEQSCNVRVLVRIRPQSQLERDGNHPVILSAPNDAEIKVRQIKKGTTLVGADKSYSFDTVFNSHSTQEEVFREAIEPLVTEVLGGFNCTVFAYGQTGTGKTHTMEGTLSSDATERDAGVIPRCVHTIFDRLQRNYAEFSVKVSFLELYNEELSDLLTEDDRQLRIFEDAAGNGRMVNGLEEAIVTTAEQVFGLLRKSQQKRRVAETNLNKNSSRSHCVFTITIHTKEVAVDGDDVIKTGKLHLVDLAGSECVGRSGAQNQRAKEAGKINQSLLTLGRVINALLTRLLQESLGGRSKTCIIATVSPSAVCIDESMSTLDYASRAKHIKNKPQVNQKLTKKSYMRDLVGQIARLKAENEALRTKNGVFLPPEQYEELTEGFRSKVNLLEEAEFTLAAKEKEMAELRELFDGKKQELAESARRVEEVTMKLEVTREVLADTRLSLHQAELQVDESEFLVAQQAATERALAAEAGALHATVERVLRDKNALHGVVERKTALERTHLDAVARFHTAVTGVTAAVTAAVADDREAARAAAQSAVATVEAHATAVTDKSRKLDAALGAHHGAETAALAGLATSIQSFAATAATEAAAECERAVAGAAETADAVDALAVAEQEAVREATVMVAAAAESVRATHTVYEEQAQALIADSAARHARVTQSVTAYALAADAAHVKAAAEQEQQWLAAQAATDAATEAAAGRLTALDAALESSAAQLTVAADALRGDLERARTEAVAHLDRVAADTAAFADAAAQRVADDAATASAESASLQAGVTALATAAMTQLGSLTQQMEEQAALEVRRHKDASAAVSAHAATAAAHGEEMERQFADAATALDSHHDEQQGKMRRQEEELQAFERAMGARLEQETAALLQGMSALVLQFKSAQLSALSAAVTDMRAALIADTHAHSEQHSRAMTQQTRLRRASQDYTVAAASGFAQTLQTEKTAHAELVNATMAIAESTDAFTAQTKGALDALGREIQTAAGKAQQRSQVLTQQVQTFHAGHADQIGAAVVRVRDAAARQSQAVTAAQEAAVTDAAAHRAAAHATRTELAAHAKQAAASAAGAKTAVRSEGARYAAALREFRAEAVAALEASAAAAAESVTTQRATARAMHAAARQGAEQHATHSAAHSATFAASVAAAVDKVRGRDIPAVRARAARLQSELAAHETTAVKMVAALQLAAAKAVESHRGGVRDVREQCVAHSAELARTVTDERARQDRVAEAVQAKTRDVAARTAKLAKEEVLPDTHAGASPKRRAFVYPAAFTRTRAHDEVRADYRAVAAAIAAAATTAAATPAAAQTTEASGAASTETAETEGVESPATESVAASAESTVTAAGAGVEVVDPLSIRPVVPLDKVVCQVRQNDYPTSWILAHEAANADAAAAETDVVADVAVAVDGAAMDTVAAADLAPLTDEAPVDVASAAGEAAEAAQEEEEDDMGFSVQMTPVAVTVASPAHSDASVTASAVTASAVTASAAAGAPGLQSPVARRVPTAARAAPTPLRTAASGPAAPAPPSELTLALAAEATAEQENLQLPSPAASFSSVPAPLAAPAMPAPTPIAAVAAVAHVSANGKPSTLSAAAASAGDAAAKPVVRRVTTGAAPVSRLTGARTALSSASSSSSVSSSAGASSVVAARRALSTSAASSSSSAASSLASRSSLRR